MPAIAASLAIRDVSAADHSAWLPLWDAYLRFYGVTLAQGVTDRTWARILDPGSPLSCRIAFLGGHAMGFANFLHHPSTWVAGDDCYLEDLYVCHEARGRGLGRALIDDLTALARARGWHRIYWHTNSDNTRARALYDSYVLPDGHVRYRMPL